MARTEATNLVVVGAGLGGLAAAIAAAERGFTVTLLEKGEKVGGAAAYSGGKVWIPGNHLQAAAGIEDSIEDGATYVRAAAKELPGLRNEVSMITWLRTAPQAAQYFEDLGVVEWEIIPKLADYHLDLPGAKAEGRSLSARFRTQHLGAWRDKMLISPHHPIGVPYDELFTQGENDELEDNDRKRPLQFTPVASAGFEKVREIPELLTFGTGVVAGFVARASEDNRISILTEHGATELIQEDGAVVGVRALDADGGTHEFHGHVVLATSGFDWNPALVEKYMGLSWEDSGSLAPRTLTGDGLQMALAVGANDVTIPVQFIPLAPGMSVDSELGFRMANENALPHTFSVDSSGRRFADDGTYWSLTGNALNPDDPHVPFYMIWDDQHRQKYGLGDTPPGEEYPAGTAESADTLEELGAKLGISGDELQRTADRFNHYAERGEDPDFGRGSNAFTALSWGDPYHKPNPALGPVSQPPFFGKPYRLIGSGICLSGVEVDAEARVLDRNGGIIEGLSAIGSCAAFTTSGTGYTSGFALSRAITHAYLVARRLEGRGLSRP